MFSSSDECDFEDVEEFSDSLNRGVKYWVHESFVAVVICVEGSSILLFST